MRLNGTLLCGGMLLALGGMACGDDDKEGGGGGGSYQAIAGALENPTGTLDKGNAVEVADAFENLQENGAPAGVRHAQQSQSQTVSCPAGGNYTVDATGDQSSARGVFDYNDCCYEASCCYNGSGNFFFSNDQSAAYSQCFDYNIVLSCDGEDANVDYQGCLDSTGQMAYSVEISGKTFTVSGSYSNGSGSLTITDAAGTWTCTYTDGSGSCTGDGGTLEF